VRRNSAGKHGSDYLPALEALEVRVLPSTFIVTSTANSGSGTLRAAITSANSHAGADTITFNIAGAGVHVIQPSSALPTITGPVTIDGTSQPRYSGTPLIQLDGSLAGVGTDGLYITAGSSTIKGLDITRWGGDGLDLDTGGGNLVQANFIGADPTGKLGEGNTNSGTSVFNGSSNNQIIQNVFSGNGATNNFPGLQLFGSANNNVITGNFVGTDLTGTAALGNGGVGIIVNGSQGNRIGTNGDGIGDAAERNIISANGFQGVAIFGSGANNNIVAGNYIGTDVTGAKGLGNHNNGVFIANSAQGNRIGISSGDTNAAMERNILSANAFAGVEITGSGSNGNIVAGNYIGTDATGSSALGNHAQGVFIDTGAANNVIGTNGDGVGDVLERNILSANSFAGIQIYNAANQNIVAGNYIGTDVTGTKPLGNLSQGIFINAGSQGNRIGTNGTDPDAAAERNIISDNGFSGAGNAFAGIEISDAGTNSNMVAGDLIGADVSGSAAMGNADPGIWIHNGAQGNQIGGSTSLANTIAFNQQVGVAVTDNGTTANSIRANSIYGNAQPGLDSLGIDLNWDGVTINHAGSALIGPNNLQNYPIILSASSGSTTTVSGTFNSLPSTSFILDFYASAAADPSGFGPGQIYLGSTTVNTDASGNGTFSATLATATNAGQWITATSTDPSGDTSEFSVARQLPSAPPAINPLTWTALGPTGMADGLNDGTSVSGRVTVAAADPSNANVMYIASDDGGIWKTSDWLDSSPVWTSLTDNQPSLSLGSVGYQNLVVFPGNSSILYAAVQGPNGGILKSTNGGTTWTFLANGEFHSAQVGSLAVDPTNSNTLYLAVWSGAAAGGGVYKSTNGGASWTNTTAGIHTGAASDLVMDPSNPSILYAGLTQDSNNGASDGLYETTNGGTSWTRLNGGMLTGGAVGTSIRLAIAPSATQTVYATVFNANLANSNFPFGLPQRFVTTNGGTSWTQLAALPDNDEYRWWHMLLSVSPTNSQTVYTNGDHEVYQSTDGGTHWTALFGEDPIDASFDDGGAFVMVGDRGIYRWTGGSTPFANKQGNLQNAEFYTLTLDPTNPNIMYGTAQDQNATLKYFGVPEWNYMGSGGETGKVLVSPVNDNRLYDYDPVIGAEGGAGNNLILRSDDGGATWAGADTGIDTSVAGFNLAYTAQKAFVMDPSNPDRLLVGTNVVYQTTNDAQSWTAISPQLSSGQFLSGLAIAPSAPNTIYAGTADGKVFVTTNDGSTWTEKDSGLPISTADSIVDFQINPTNPSDVFVVAGTFPTSLGGDDRAWMTTNGGTSWQEITGNLPLGDFSNSIVADWRFSTPVLYVGTARGVYRSLNVGGTWSLFGQSLPNSPVTDLQFLPQFDLLAAATYGRGVFEIQAAGPPTHFTLSTPTTATAGKSISVTVTALDSLGVRVTAYTGSVHFTSSDTSATLPTNYTFAGTDLGLHTFSGVILRKAGTTGITVSDTVASSVSGKATVKVSAGATTHFTLTASTSNPTAGTVFSITVTALDAFGNVAKGYRGTVHFTSTDPSATLPADYPFKSTDKGIHTFSVTLRTTGSQTITATDTSKSSITGSVTVTVQPAATKLLQELASAGWGGLTLADLDAYYAAEPTGSRRHLP
jgi:titin